MKHLKLFEELDNPDQNLYDFANGEINKLFNEVTETLKVLNDKFKNKYILIQMDDDVESGRFNYYLKCSEVNMGSEFRVGSERYVGTGRHAHESTFILNFDCGEKIDAKNLYSIDVNMEDDYNEIYILDDLIKNDIKKFAEIWRSRDKKIMIGQEINKFFEENEGIMKAIEIGIL